MKYLMKIPLIIMVFLININSVSYASSNNEFIASNIFCGLPWTPQTGDVLDKSVLAGTLYGNFFHLANIDNSYVDNNGILSPGLNVGLKVGLPGKWGFEIHASILTIGLCVAKELSLNNNWFSHTSLFVGGGLIASATSYFPEYSGGGSNVYIGWAGKKYFLQNIPLGIYFASCVGYAKASYTAETLIGASRYLGRISADGIYSTLGCGIVFDAWQKYGEAIFPQRDKKSFGPWTGTIGLKISFYSDYYNDDSYKIKYSGIYVDYSTAFFNY